MSDVLWPCPSTQRHYPGFLAETRVQPSGKLTAAQRAAEREVISTYPKAVREDWSQGMWRNRKRYCNTKRVNRSGTCAVIWWNK